MGLPYLNPDLGHKVVTRQITWKEMAIRAWGTEYSAPDHRIYVFSNGRAFDSTDRTSSGIYNGGILQSILGADTTLVTADTTEVTADSS